MKTAKMLTIFVMALGVVCQVEVSKAAPMGTDWTYQGRLMDANVPSDGVYDFEFKIFDDPCTGAQQGGTVEAGDLDVIDGYFTVELDFGSDVFDGDARWLEVGVRPGDSNDPNAFVSLSPRQKITPVPYALQTRGIFVDSSGNVGIGTTNPVGQVGLGSYQGGTAGSAVAGHNKQLILGGEYNTGYNGGSSVKLLICDYDNDAGADIYPIYCEDEQNRVDFYVRKQEGSVSSAYFGGRVGIGTTSPAAKMDVVDGSMSAKVTYHQHITQPLITDTYAGVKGAYGNDVEGFLGRKYVTPWTTSYCGIFGSATTSGINFGVFGEASGGSENWAGYFNGDVYASGKLGIGTNNPTAKLDVKSPGSGEDVISAHSSAGSEMFLVTEDGLGNGKLFVRNASGVTKVQLATYGYSLLNGGNVGIGVAGVPTSTLQVDGRTTTTELFATELFAMELFVDGRTTTDELQIMGGADLAEPFEISDAAEIPAGALVVIDEETPGQLKLSRQAYDKRVAGVVSGAGGIKSGLVLSQKGTLDQGPNVALSGRVYAQANCCNGPIRPGDMLTTSDTPGYAMKATDPERSYGAVIGKAMSSLQSGEGLILVLVNLQ